MLLLVDTNYCLKYAVLAVRQLQMTYMSTTDKLQELQWRCSTMMKWVTFHHVLAITRRWWQLLQRLNDWCYSTKSYSACMHKRGRLKESRWKVRKLVNQLCIASCFRRKSNMFSGLNSRVHIARASSPVCFELLHQHHFQSASLPETWIHSWSLYVVNCH